MLFAFIHTHTHIHTMPSFSLINNQNDEWIGQNYSMYYNPTITRSRRHWLAYNQPVSQTIYIKVKDKNRLHQYTCSFADQTTVADLRSGKRTRVREHCDEANLKQTNGNPFWYKCSLSQWSGRIRHGSSSNPGVCIPGDASGSWRIENGIILVTTCSHFF